MSLLQILLQKRDDVLRIAAKHGAENVRVFGSVARNEETAASDIDLLVNVGAHPTPFFPGGMIAELEQFLGRPVDVITEPALHWFIREQVLSEAKPL